MAAGKSASPPISLFHRSAAAAGASLVSAIVVNPLDVVKTRLQAQGAFDATTRAFHTEASLLEKWNFAGCGPTCVRITNPALPSNVCGPACEPPLPYKGTYHALRTIARKEGISTLWRGTDIALMMSIPMVGIYLPLYDYLLEGAQQQGVGAAAPLLAGTLARTVAVYCTAPFELIRTRIQAVQSPAISPAGYGISDAKSSGSYGSSFSTGGTSSRTSSSSGRLLQHLPMLDKTSKTRALRSLWTGVGATLARDVPFSGLYWAMVEPIRKNLLPPEGASSEMEVMVANVAAGGISGGLSGAITTPLDVVKTRTQLQMGTDHPVLRTLASILKQEGATGLFSGWSARAAKSGAGVCNRSFCL
ncbi:hypothetical protein Ndes2526B_g03448 [Nannochloris sp. 'desiccata']